MVGQLRFSVESLTVGDMEDLEEACGLSLDEILALLTNRAEEDTIGIPIKVLKALVWVIHRQGNPDFTLDDARNVKVGELVLVLSEPDPTEAAG